MHFALTIDSCLPSFSFGHSFVSSIISAIGEELTGQLVCISVHSVDPEAYLVDALDLAGGPPPLHQTDDSAAQPLRVVRVW